MRTKILEIAKVIEDNPDLPVLVFAEDEIISDDYKWNWVGGGRAVVEDVYYKGTESQYNETYTLGAENIYPLIKDEFDIGGDIRGLSVQERYNELCNKGQIKQTIVIYLGV